MAAEKIERRRARRYPVGDGILVSTPTRTGEVLNIGMGGLSFRSIDGRILPSGFEPGIIFGEDEMILEEIPLKMIGDYTHRAGEAMRLRVRQIGARFGELTEEQKELLRDFIHLHARP